MAERRCWQGLSELAEQRGNHAGALEHPYRAGALIARHQAKFFLDQVIEEGVTCPRYSYHLES